PIRAGGHPATTTGGRRISPTAATCARGGLDERGVLLDDRQRAPPRTKSDTLPRQLHQHNSYDGERVHHVIVKERVIGVVEVCEVHHAEQTHCAPGPDLGADPEREGEAHPEETEHEQPVERAEGTDREV